MSVDLITIFGIILGTPVGILLKVDPIHHIIAAISPANYASSLGLQIWIAVSIRIPICTIIALDIARCWIYIAMIYVVGSKIFLRYLHLIEQPYRHERFFAVATRKKLGDSITSYREILVLLKIIHYALMTLSSCGISFLAMTVVAVNYLSIKMHHVIPGIVLYFGFPVLLVCALWLPYHTLPECGEFAMISTELLRKWRLRGGGIGYGGKGKSIAMRLRSLLVNYFKFGMGQFVMLNITRGTKGRYHKVIIDYTISALLFKLKV